MKEEGSRKSADGGKSARRVDLILRLVSGFGAVAVSVSVAAILLDCRFERYSLVWFNPARCATVVEVAESVSASAGVGFLAFLVLEGFSMILASMWLERERKAAEQRQREEAERAERIMEAAERRAEAAERTAEAAERRAESAELQRREEAERAERRAEAAERREERLLALLERRNGGSAQHDTDDESGNAQE